MVVSHRILGQPITEALGHYFSKISKQRAYTCYDIDEDICKVCGCKLKSTNAITCHNTRRQLEEFGLKFREVEPVEAIYDDVKDEIFCEECFCGEPIIDKGVK